MLKSKGKYRRVKALPKISQIRTSENSRSLNHLSPSKPDLPEPPPVQEQLPLWLELAHRQLLQHRHLEQELDALITAHLQSVD